MKRAALLGMVAGALGAMPALGQNLIFNPSFETLNASGQPEGWRLFSQARFRTVGDGLTPPAVARTGVRSAELFADPGIGVFQGFDNDVFNPDTLTFYDPVYTWQGGTAVFRVWWYIPSSAPLTNSTAKYKAEFRRRDDGNLSIAWSKEVDIPIRNAGNQIITDTWTQFEFRVTDAEINAAAGPFPPPPRVVSTLPLLFPANAAGSSGSIFFDDLQYFQTSPCRADWNNDGSVNSADITAFLANWFADRVASPQTTVADINGDGVTNSADITSFLSQWFAVRSGQNCP